MKVIFFALLLLGLPAEASMPPTSYPIFLRHGFSCVLEFESAPKRVVIGDSQSFQIEKMEKSIVIRATTAYASSNMFVYFDSGEPRLFILSASEDAEPTLYRKFESPRLPVKQEKRPKSAIVRSEGFQLVSAKFDSKKDYLTVDAKISAGSVSAIWPSWDLVRIKSGNSVFTPPKTWAERKEVQKDASVRARFIFAKPNISRNLKNVTLVLPVQGRISPLSLHLGGK